MKKKKKKIEEVFFDFNDKLIGVENNYVNGLNKIDFHSLKIIDKFIENNSNLITKSFTQIKNDIFKKLLQSFNFNNQFDKYNFIKTFNVNFNIQTLFKKKITSYFKIYNKQDYVEYIDFFIGLIKDDKCVPFWNDDIKKISDKIFLPIDSELNKLNNPNTFNYTNWFETHHFINKNPNKNFDKIEINKKRNFNLHYTDKKTKTEKFIIKSIKVKLFLNGKQKQYLTELYGVYRYFYNRAIQYINNYDKKNKSTFYLVDYDNDKTKKNINLTNVKNKYSYITLRKYLKSNIPNWMEKLKIDANIEIQSHLIDMAFKEACGNYSKCMEKYKKDKKPFKLKFKTKKDKYQTLNIEKCMFKLFNERNIKKNKKKKNNEVKNKHKNMIVLFPGIKIKQNKKTESVFNIRVRENFSKLDICDSSITCNKRTNEYFLNLNYHDDSIRDINILKNKKVCSVDPGLSCLLNVYSDNEFHYIGKNIMEKIRKVCEEIDIITSVMNLKKKKTDVSKSKSKMKIKYRYNSNRRRNLKKALGRRMQYLENLKTELHNKGIKFLTSNYGKIIIPHLDSKGMSKKFNSKLARSLYSISYSTFMKKLETKCKEYDIELVSRPEYYTSKTCTKCGNIKIDLKLTDRTYECTKCQIKINRDANASRNIMLRNNIMESKCELSPLADESMSLGISHVQN